MKQTTKTDGRYESPHLELIPFGTEDVITASGGELGEWDTEL